MFRWLAVSFVFVLCLFLVTDSIQGAQKKKKKGAIAGAVTAIDPVKDKDGKEVKDTYTITVKTPQKKNKKSGTVTEAKEHKFEVKPDTKVERAGKKKQPAEPATFAEVQAGQNVAVTIRADTTNVADKIVIQKKKKKAQ